MAEQKYSGTSPSTQDPLRRHRNQSLWQIWLPICVVFLLGLGLFSAVLLVTQSGTMELGNIQAIAIILIILPLGAIGILTFIGLIIAISGTGKLFAIAPSIRRISHQVDSISSTLKTWSNRIMMPIVVFKDLRHRLRPGKIKSLID